MKLDANIINDAVKKAIDLITLNIADTDGNVTKSGMGSSFSQTLAIGGLISHLAYASPFLALLGNVYIVCYQY